MRVHFKKNVPTGKKLLKVETGSHGLHVCVFKTKNCSIFFPAFSSDVEAGFQVGNGVLA